MDSNEYRAKSPKKAGRFFSCGIGFLILLGAVYLISTVFTEGWDLLQAPWAHTISLKPTLTGSWMGEFSSSSGVHFALYLFINRARRQDGRFNTQRAIGAILDGQAQWCDNTGRHVQNVPISGSVPAFTGFNATANKIHIALMLKGQIAAGLWPDELNGKWNGDILTLTPSLANWDGNNTVSTVDETAGLLTMKKADQNTYQELCKKLSGSNP